MYSGDTHYDAPLDQSHLEKVVLAQKVGQTIVQNESVHERIAAESIARSLIADVSVIVRQTLAFELRRANRVSYDIAEKIAKDVYEVASPFLEASRAISDSALVKLVPELDEAALIAIAKRSALSAELAYAVVEHGAERSVTYVMRNDKADVTEAACHRAIERFEPSSTVFTEMAQRNDLTRIIAEKLVEFVAEEYKEQLKAKFTINEKSAATVVASVKELSLMQVLALADPKYIDAYISGLKKTQRLTPEVVLKSAEIGNRYFFERSLSELTNLPQANVELLAANGGSVALEKLLKKANISSAYSKQFAKALADLY